MFSEAPSIYTVPVNISALEVCNTFWNTLQSYIPTNQFAESQSSHKLHDDL